MAKHNNGSQLVVATYKGKDLAAIKIGPKDQTYIRGYDDPSEIPAVPRGHVRVFFACDLTWEDVPAKDVRAPKSAKHAARVSAIYNASLAAAKAAGPRQARKHFASIGLG